MTENNNPQPPEDQTDQGEEETINFCPLKPIRLRAGMTCPYCHAETLEYNGMLQLVCPRCGVLETGVFT